MGRTSMERSMQNLLICFRPSRNISYNAPCFSLHCCSIFIGYYLRIHKHTSRQWTEVLEKRICSHQGSQHSTISPTPYIPNCHRGLQPNSHRGPLRHGGNRPSVQVNDHSGFQVHMREDKVAPLRYLICVISTITCYCLALRVILEVAILCSQDETISQYSSHLMDQKLFRVKGNPDILPLDSYDEKKATELSSKINNLKDP
jgi:hypothetical protein